MKNSILLPILVMGFFVCGALRGFDAADEWTAKACAHSAKICVNTSTNAALPVNFFVLEKVTGISVNSEQELSQAYAAFHKWQVAAVQSWQPKPGQPAPALEKIQGYVIASRLLGMAEDLKTRGELWAALRLQADYERSSNIKKLKTGDLLLLLPPEFKFDAEAAKAWEAHQATMTRIQLDLALRAEKLRPAREAQEAERLSAHEQARRIEDIQAEQEAVERAKADAAEAKRMAKLSAEQDRLAQELDSTPPPKARDISK